MPDQKRIDNFIYEFKNELLEIFTDDDQTIQELQAEINRLSGILANANNTELVIPEYGTIPVPAVIHEQVMELAQVRGVAPAILMNNPKVIRHLLLLFEMEII